MEELWNSDPVIVRAPFFFSSANIDVSFFCFAFLGFSFLFLDKSSFLWAFGTLLVQYGIAFFAPNNTRLKVSIVNARIAFQICTHVQSSFLVVLRLGWTWASQIDIMRRYIKLVRICLPELRSLKCS